MTDTTKKYGNREYKSDVFSMMAKVPKYALDIYNAMNDTDYTDPNLVEILVLENGISLSVRNDASFLISSYLNLYEHQSTYSPNAPLRFLIYLTNLLMRLIKREDLYRKKLVKIETPHFVVFYNGKEKRPEREILKLSDSFINQTDNPEIELICTVLNINPEYNTELLKKSRVLRGYMYFVSRGRDNLEKQKNGNQEEDLEAAIYEAIDNCIENHVMEEFFRENRNEVAKNMVLDYTWKRREELIRAEEYEDGRQDGVKAGILLGRAEGEKVGMKHKLTDLVGKKIKKGYGSEQIAEMLEEDITVIEPIYDEIMKASLVTETR